MDAASRLTAGNAAGAPAAGGPVFPGFDDREFLDLFRVEAEEGLAQMEQALVSLEAQPADEEALGIIFRQAHTLKGNAASLGLVSLRRFAHALEDLLDRVRERTVPVSRRLVTLLLQSLDVLRAMVPAAVSGKDQMTPAQAALLRKLEAKARGRTRGAGDEEPVEVAPPVSAPALEPVRGGADAPRSLRVDIHRLDRMLNLTGEITIAQGRIRQMLEAPGTGREDLLQAHDEAERQYLDLQEEILKVRMVPIGPVFRQHIRTVRDLAAGLGKLARLVLEGEDVEVDTSVVEHVRDPLVHLIRNALDHGIERPEVRRAAGKDASGRITLRARHEAGRIAIQVEDDGAGLDRQCIVQRGIARGMVADPEKLTDQEAYRLILEPGFSTAEEVTDVSGRGVGMDVVLRNVEALRGTVGIESRRGEGTTITLSLPLTLAIIDGFAVRVGGEDYVIPLEAVIECVELPPAEGARAQGVLNLRGTPLPYARLGEVFGASGAAARQQSVIVVRHEAGHAGLAVDELLGTVAVVVKPLGKPFRGLPGLAGSTILASGRVCLILDVPALLRMAIGRPSQASGGVA
jgi:two-component system chemotaxis sensor kinase CheA